MDGPPAEDRLRSAAADDPTELYEHAPCGLVTWSLDGTIRRANETLLRWLGRGRDEVVGASRFHDLLAPGDRIYYETHYAPLLHMQGEVRAIAVELVRADGRRLACIVNGVLVEDAAGRPASIHAAVFDATDRRLYEQELLRAREEAERTEERAQALARVLQASLIPPAPPQIPGLDVGAAYRPIGEGAEVGGDFYDFLELPSGAWTVMIGDVSGKGPEAAGVTALARYTARATAIRADAPSDVLESVNAALFRDRSERFCTMCVVRIPPIEGGRATITLCSAGHPLPLRASSNRGIQTLGRPGSLLGLFDDVALVDDVEQLDPSDVVLLYTDGVVEARGHDGLFGEERLRSLLERTRDASAVTIARTIAETVVGFQDGSPRDDVAVLVLKRLPEVDP